MHIKFEECKGKEKVNFKKRWKRITKFHYGAKLKRNIICCFPYNNADRYYRGVAKQSM